MVACAYCAMQMCNDIQCTAGSICGFGHFCRYFEHSKGQKLCELVQAVFFSQNSRHLSGICFAHSTDFSADMLQPDIHC